MCCYTCISLLTKTYFVQLATPKPHFFSRGAAPEALVGGCTPKPPPTHFLHPMGTPENHTLACLLHCQLNAPLKRFQKVLFYLVYLFLRSIFFCYYKKDIFWKLKEHAPATWYCMLPMHLLIEVSRTLESASAHHAAGSLKFGFSWAPEPSI